MLFRSQVSLAAEGSSVFLLPGKDGIVVQRPGMGNATLRLTICVFLDNWVRQIAADKEGYRMVKTEDLLIEGAPASRKAGDSLPLNGCF